MSCTFMCIKPYCISHRLLNGYSKVIGSYHWEKFYDFFLFRWLSKFSLWQFSVAKHGANSTIHDVPMSSVNTLDLRQGVSINNLALKSKICSKNCHNEPYQKCKRKIEEDEFTNIVSSYASEKKKRATEAVSTEKQHLQINKK